MTKWLFQLGSSLDTEADGLICAANQDLNLRGGIGESFVLPYSRARQEHLQSLLRDTNSEVIAAGRSIIAPPFGLPYTAVAHTVCVDGDFKTDNDTILASYNDAIEKLREVGCKSIVGDCLGWGYTTITSEDFAKIIETLYSKDYEGVESITLMSIDGRLFDRICNHWKDH